MNFNSIDMVLPHVWAGIECSHNRVGDTFIDQLTQSRHYERPEDIRRFAELGIKALHYPLLWEHHQPQRTGAIEWGWVASQLNQLHSLAISPVVGLLHHGSGPLFTHLLDDDFAKGLSTFARQVAWRFPWITYYKPINEPLTTARFGGLYGVWHPHAKEDVVFAKIFLNQLKAIVLSMQEIKKINPYAQLIQTEDLSKTYSIPSLQYQADFENQRRWLTYDFLVGRFNRHHSLWDYFRGLGISEKTLLFFSDHPCPPDILGVNHYITSERFLDSNLSLYPSHLHGGNHQESYADIEAIRINHRQPSGLKLLLEELYARYSKKIALTEVHLHCTREEQLRWLAYVWNLCVELNQEKTIVSAFTAWSLVGAYGWNKLLTEPNGEYESGIFDLRSPRPRPTILAKFIKTVSEGKSFSHPVLAQKGWWEKENRFLDAPPFEKKAEKYNRYNESFLLIYGDNGPLCKVLEICCQQRGIAYQSLNMNDEKIEKGNLLKNQNFSSLPWAIINAIDFMNNSDLYRKVACKIIKEFKELREHHHEIRAVKLLTFSSVMVFDGRKKTPYLESDRASASHAIAQNMIEVESMVSQAPYSSLIIRSGLYFGPYESPDIWHQTLSEWELQLWEGNSHDIVISLVYLPDLAQMALDLLIDDEIGVWHLSNGGEVKYSELLQQIENLPLSPQVSFSPIPLEDFSYGATSRYVLGSAKGSFLPTLDHALNRYLREARFLEDCSK